jgi:hypothetical protein
MSSDHSIILAAAALRGQVTEAECWTLSDHDERDLGCFFTNTGGNKKNAYTVQQKEEAAGERSALLSKHSFTAFDGVRESAKRGPECIRDGLFLVPVAVLILGGMAYAAQVVQCEAPLYRMCLTAVAPTYTCGFGPDGTCVATPIAA